MDFNALKDSVSNLTLYDLKAGVRKVQNAVMNYTEMEAKVREATNNEPWGASSTLMQEIANGTFNYQTLNEIMPMIYRRFTEKAAEEWRQIYKALQLLEFLVKHGSERVIDDARSHLTLLKMLRQFHFIDANGKDQGINVRNRAKELTELLSDVDRIRAERKKARANKAKFTGVEGGSSFTSTGRYSGFGSDSGFGSGGGGGSASGGYGGYSGGVYGDGGVFGGRTMDYNEAGGGSLGGTGGNGDKFEEYDEFDEGNRPARTTTASSGSSGGRPGVRRTTSGTGASNGNGSSSRRTESVSAPPKKKQPEVDLFSFDDPVPTTTVPAAAATSTAGGEDEDDFDDFQSAAPIPAAAPAAAPASSSLAGLSLSSPPLTTSNAMGAQFAAPQPVSAPKQANLADMVGFSSISPAPAQTTGTGAPNYSAFRAPPLAAAAPAAAPGYVQTQPNYYQSVQASPQGSTPTSVFPSAQSQKRQSSSAGMAALRPALPSSTSASKSSSGGGSGDAFGALWSQASTGIKKNNTGSSGPGPTMGQLAQEKSNAAIWGVSHSAASTPKPAASSSGNGLDDLLG